MNKSTEGKAVSLDNFDSVVRYEFDAGMSVTVFSPGRPQLAKLRDKYQ